MIRGKAGAGQAPHRGMIVSEVREEERVTTDVWAVEEPSFTSRVGGVEGVVGMFGSPRYIGRPEHRLLGFAGCGTSEMSSDEDKTET